MSDLHDESFKSIINSLSSGVNSSRTILRDSNDKSWYKIPYQVKLGGSFQKVSDDLAFRSQNATKDDVDIGISKNVTMSGIGSFFGMDADDSTVSTLLSKAYHQDTRVGANDAINCLWQFNRDDDIVHPICLSEPSTGIGLGRVYTNTTQVNQQICYFTFGVPYYASLLAFHKNAFNQKLAELNAKGYDSDEGSWTLGELIGESLSLIVAIPVIPLKIMYETITHSSFNYKINRFYELRARMSMYYKYVDAMLGHWLVAVGMYGNAMSWEGMGNTGLAVPESVPKALKLTGCSIWEIVTRRARNSGTYPYTRAEHESAVQNSLLGRSSIPLRYHNDAKARTSDMQQNDAAAAGSSIRDLFNQAASRENWDDTDYDKFLKDLQNEQLSAYNNAIGCDASIAAYDDDHGNWGTVFIKSALGATQYIGFRVDKSTDASESFSNSTSPSAYAESFNSKVRELAAQAIDKGLKGSEAGDSWIESLVTDAKSLISGVMEALKKIDFIGITDLADAAMTGIFLDVPEQYSGSDFNKSHSLSFQLRSPYGDKVSIYQSIMVPLACILAGALPRAGGANSYVQPFLCRVYCRGMFAVPMGIIDSVSIKRGDSEFGWTYDNLPTCIDVSISIKDMSPVMYMMMYDTPWQELFGIDNAFNEYMLTLAGVGLFERISQIKKIVRGMGYTAHTLRNRYFNPLYWSHNVSQFTVVQFVASFVPKITIGNNN